MDASVMPSSFPWMTVSKAFDIVLLCGLWWILCCAGLKGRENAFLQSSTKKKIYEQNLAKNPLTASNHLQQAKSQSVTEIYM